MKPAIDPEHVSLRPAEVVMKLARMGSFHQTRLSFMRVLLRRLKQARWTFQRSRWQVNEQGVGTAIYEAKGPEGVFSLVAFAHDLPAEKRSDRVIADRWDATFALYDGIPGEEDIRRMARNVPLQEAGSCSQTELVLARANRSVRLFDHVVERLSLGEQPDPDAIRRTGYLMRTTAVYGNGKFGLGDRARISERGLFSGPFQAEMLAVWLIRWFTCDIAEHLARMCSPSRAVPLDRSIRARLGVGNSTGLGMAPFLGTHPALVHSWIHARESALARVRSLSVADADSRERFARMLLRARAAVNSWHTDNPRQADRVRDLVGDLVRLDGHLKTGALQHSEPWDRLYRWGEASLTLEGQEMLVSLIIEPHGALVDDLAGSLSVDELPYTAVDGSWRIGDTLSRLHQCYHWALDIDFDDPAACARFWYVSEEKLEPRLGERHQEHGSDKEQPLAFGRDASLLAVALEGWPADGLLADFLMARPEFRAAVRRLQLACRLPYAEIQDNLIAADMVPVDLLRCKLSFFGATRFDPRSDRWVRITMFQDAPFPDELDEKSADDWVYPSA